MEEEQEEDLLITGITQILQDIHKNYSLKILEYIEEHPDLINQVTGFLIYPKNIIAYIGKTHLAIEFNGLERLDTLFIEKEYIVELEIHNYTASENHFLEDIIGFKYDSTSNITLDLAPLSIDLILPTNKGFDKLMDLNWNFFAQDMFLGINSSAPELLENQFTRIVNGLFFDANEHGLITRHIKWIDFLPIEYEETNEESAKISINPIKYYSELIEHDANFVYPLPDDDDYKLKKLPQINRFIELIANKRTTETNITKFLAQNKNKFILTMHFGAKNIFDELVCEWQSDNKDTIRPDFFILQANGYAHILEFKLPDLKSKAITEKHNRETFSAEINSYISQTRVYETYFDDPNNRKWFENKYGFKVHKPKRILVAGRRSNFESDEFREIQADFRNIELLTFDDLIDGVKAQFYL